MNTERYRDEIVEYRKWLENQCPDTHKRYIDRLSKGGVAMEEAAIGEAVGWAWLASRCDIKLAEDPSQGGSDFRCSTRNGYFYTEVCTLTIDQITKKTGLPHLPDGPRFYSPALGDIKPVVCRKAGQHAERDAPLLIFVVVLHFQYSAVVVCTDHLSGLLLGNPALFATIDLESGESVGEVENRYTLDHTLFFEKDTAKATRKNLSGVLVGGFGAVRDQCRVIGVLHPDPRRPFEQRMLPDVCFGTIQPWPLESGSQVVWTRADGAQCDDTTEQLREQANARRRLQQAGLWPIG